MKAVKRCVWLVLWLLSGMAWWPAAPAPAQTPRRQVLYLNSYHRGYKFSDEITRGLETVLKAPESNIDLYVEYMDTKRVATDAYLEQLYQTYKVKYAHHKFDLVVSSDDAALNFLFKYADELFPDTPVVFCGANFFDVSRLAGHPQFTGVSEEADIQGALALMLQLHPGTRQIVVVNDTTLTGQRVHERLLQFIPDYPAVKFVLLEDVAMAEILQTVRALPADSLVYLTLFASDNTGALFEYDVGARLIAEASAVPVYATWDFSLGYGVVGGKLTSGAVEGERAAQLALRVLQGASPQDIPVVEEIASRYMFDYEQLQRWRISQQALPDDSFILNRPTSFFENYPEVVWSVGISFVILITIAAGLWLNILRRRRIEAALQERNRELQAMQDSLAQRVAERTQIIEQRAAFLQTAAEVSRATTELVDPEALFNRVVELVQERFNLYYVGLFLADPEREWAVLQAGAGEAGRQMVAQNWRVRIGETSMIGRCVATGAADIQLDVGETAAPFENPFLPETHSEMALPLRARGEILGAMTLQSTRAAAFDAEDLRTMQTLADQVAVAISNARLFRQAQESLEAERRAHGEATQTAWRELLRVGMEAQVFSATRQGAAAPGDWRPEMKAALRSGEIVHGPAGDTLAIPLLVRDQVVGVMDGRKPDGAAWTEEEIRVLTAMVDQLNVALEGARLYRETQRRAAREQVTREISDALQRAVSIEALMRIATEELNRSLGGSHAYVRLNLEGAATSETQMPPGEGDHD